MFVVSLVLIGLTVISGCMFAGKSETLINVYDRLKRTGRSVIAYKPDIDNRFDPNKIVSHSGAELGAVPVNGPREILGHLEEIRQSGGNVDVVLIDEVQFFDETIVYVVQRLLREGYKVVVAGLNLDFKGEPFGSMPTLLSLADYRIGLYPVCEVCGGPATRTQRLIDGIPASIKDPLVVVGADEFYEARCPQHHEVRYD